MSGTVVGWEDGRLTHDHDESIKSAIMEVEVGRRFTSEGSTHTLYVEVPRGGALINPDGSYVSGLVEQGDVAIGQWPAAVGRKAGSFQMLVDELLQNLNG